MSSLAYNRLLHDDDDESVLRTCAKKGPLRECIEKKPSSCNLQVADYGGRTISFFMTASKQIAIFRTIFMGSRRKWRKEKKIISLYSFLFFTIDF